MKPGDLVNVLVSKAGPPGLPLGKEQEDDFEWLYGEDRIGLILRNIRSSKEVNKKYGKLYLVLVEGKKYFANERWLSRKI